MKNNKSLGQHWLQNRQILDEIADLASSDIEDAVCIEIGPGLGTLTSSLLRRFPKVIAIEFDQQLADNLPGSFPGKNLEVIHGDILQTELPSLVQDSAYVVVGNIPYYITSPIVRQLLSQTPLPQRIVLLMQKEVAERIAAEPGDHSLLSLIVQNRATVTLGPVVKAAEFTPPPKVDSQITVITPLPEPQIPDASFRLIERGFTNPRKKLSANLAGLGHTKAEWEAIFQQNGIGQAVRAEALSLPDWANLAKNLLEHK